MHWALTHAVRCVLAFLACGPSVSYCPSLCFRQSDVDMWAALEAVQMKEYIKALPEGLDAPVSEGGGNLSVRLPLLSVLFPDSPPPPPPPPQNN